MKLPGSELAHIDADKVRNYLLSEEHHRGRFKAAFFASLGYRRENWREFEAGLRVLIAEADARVAARTEYGQKYVVSGTLAGPARRSRRVTTVWIVLWGEAAPRLLTAYPETQR